MLYVPPDLHEFFQQDMPLALDEEDVQQAGFQNTGVGHEFNGDFNGSSMILMVVI